jgi:hypothetical protein
VPGRLWAVRKYPIRGRNGRTVPDARPHVAVLCEIPGSGGRWADTAHHPEDQPVPGARNAVIMTVPCLIIAAKLIGDGISGLTG